MFRPIDLQECETYRENMAAQSRFADAPFRVANGFASCRQGRPLSRFQAQSTAELRQRLPELAGKKAFEFRYLPAPFCALASTFPRERTAQGVDPLGNELQKQPDPLRALAGLGIELHEPFDERAVAVDDRRQPQRALVVDG